MVKLPEAFNPLVMAFPKNGIAYNEALYGALQTSGVDVKEGVYAGRWLVKNLKRHHIVHLHWPSFFYARKKSIFWEICAFAKFCLFLLAVRCFCRSLVWTAHNLYPHNPSKTPYLDKVARWTVILFASKILIHRETAAKRFIEEFPLAKSKVTIVDHGNWVDYYPYSTTQAAARERFNIPQDKFVYLFVGLCSRYKNVDRLVEAFDHMPDNCTLLIAGKFQDPEYYKKIRGTIDKITHKQIHMDAKFIPDEELQYYLLASDVVVLPYADSLTSGAAVLALGFGRPVIAPKLGYLTDIIDESSGLLYFPNDTQRLVEAMQKIREEDYAEGDIRAYASTLSWESACAALR